MRWEVAWLPANIAETVLGLVSLMMRARIKDSAQGRIKAEDEECATEAHGIHRIAKAGGVLDAGARASVLTSTGMEYWSW